MYTKTFSYNGATVTLRRATVRDRLITGIIANKLLPDNQNSTGIEETIAFVYARLLSQATVEGTLGIPWPEPSASPDELQAALDAFLDAPPALYDALRAAQFEVDEVATPDTAPEGDSPKKA